MQQSFVFFSADAMLQVTDDEMFDVDDADEVVEAAQAHWSHIYNTFSPLDNSPSWYESLL